jgi:hypothetical protein
MIVLADRAAIERGPSLPLDAELRNLLASRVRHLASSDPCLLDCSVIIVIEPGDQESDLIEATGFSLLLNPIDGARWGSTAYVPWVDYVHRASINIYEAIVTIGNDGFAVHVLIPDLPGMDTSLAGWCREYAGEARSPAQPS